MAWSLHHARRVQEVNAWAEGVESGAAPVILAALVPGVVNAVLIRNAGGIVDRLELDGAVRCLRDVANQVIDRAATRSAVARVSRR